MVVTLGKIWKENDVTDRELRVTAFHEVCESMFFDLEQLALNREYSRELEAERHALVNRIYYAIHGEGI